MADFFNTPTDPDPNDEPEKIHVGDKEYTQDELQQLVSLGSLGREAEEKFNTKLDKVYPEYTRTTQRVKELEDQLKTYENQQLQQRQQTGQLTPEDQIAQALQEAQRIGIVTNSSARDIIREELDARDLLSEVNDIVADAAEIGIATDPHQILQHMADEDFKDPYRAFEDMNQDKLDSYRARELSKLKGNDLYTTEEGQAEIRQPERVRITDENIQAALTEAMS